MDDTAKLSPVRPLHDVVVAATTPTGGNPPLYAPQGWSFKSHTGLVAGFTIKQIVGSDGSLPSALFIGFNRQPPAYFFVGDVFKYTPGFRTLEIYNHTAVNWTIDGILFTGDLIP